jgi:hypothetical protein
MTAATYDAREISQSGMDEENRRQRAVNDCDLGGRPFVSV